MKVYDVPGLESSVITRIEGKPALLLAGDLSQNERVATMLDAMRDLDVDA